MRRKTIKKVIGWTLGTIVLLFVVLVVHIYLVTRVKPPDEHTIVMARMDFKDSLGTADVTRISSWLYQQKGIGHVLVNPDSRIAVFTFYPLHADANAIINAFKAQTGYHAERFMPSEEDMKNGCPVASTSVTYKLASFIKRIF